MGSIPTIGFMNLEQKSNSLQQILKDLTKVVVAYSGGVDSTFLLKSAVDTLGPQNVLACVATGASLPQSELTSAVKLAEALGVEIQTVEPDELSDPNYAANKADRCFHCKSHLFALLTDLAKKRNFNHVICGHNLDDMDDYRPGIRAAKAFGIRSPLADAELTKDDIRRLSRKLNLPTADVPASPCLASRISYGLEITEQRLKQVEQAEAFLRTFGLVEFRVRLHESIARIEVHPEDIAKITTETVRSRIVEKLKSLGFKFVTLDLQGFRSGSLNEMLSEDQKQKSL